MTGAQRREQLIDVAREVFAERGFASTAIEEIAARADVSKPVVYEHFGGKDGLYSVVIEREVTALLTTLREALRGDSSRQLLEQATIAFLQHIEENPEGFRILIRDRAVGSPFHTQQSIIGDIATSVEGLIRDVFVRQRIDTVSVPLYAQMLVGIVAQTGRWWLDNGMPDRRTVATHVVNFAWNGLSGMDPDPLLVTELPPRARREMESAQAREQDRSRPAPR
mgnify:CR=1 FL=1